MHGLDLESSKIKSDFAALACFDSILILVQMKEGSMPRVGRGTNRAVRSLGMHKKVVSRNRRAEMCSTWKQTWC